jgi:hypothetical protein
LDLGVVRNVARVRLNGRDPGVIWTAPWRSEITDALKSGANELEIEVANLWPNRLIGEGLLPPDSRLAVRNVRTCDTMTSGTFGCQKRDQRKKTGKPAEVAPSGLLGPVTLQAETSWNAVHPHHPAAGPHRLPHDGPAQPPLKEH